MDLALDGDQEPTTRLRRVIAPLEHLRLQRSSTARRASRLVSESVFEAADALLVPIIPATLSSRTLEQLHAVLEAKGTTGARLLLDGRPPQAAAPEDLMDELSREHDVLETVIPTSANVERMGAETSGARGLSRRAAQPRLARTRTSGERSAHGSSTNKVG